MNVVNDQSFNTVTMLDSVTLVFSIYILFCEL